ncbi:MAG: Rhs protein-like protein, partial [Ramlibacter sp.]|nr:Rhs protein-like protein [Ramlibacter sp.]
DPKGIVTDIAYTPRGWVSTVTVTPPGGSARTTTYTYDNVGQVTGVTLPDATSLTYTYDVAHRLTGASDARGNSVTYTLDDAGNRTAEAVRDPGGTLRRSIARSFDALDRLQQVSGAAQ